MNCQNLYHDHITLHKIYILHFYLKNINNHNKYKLNYLKGHNGKNNNLKVSDRI